MRKYKVNFFRGDHLVHYSEPNYRDAKKILKEYNEAQTREEIKADRCVVYTASMSRIADVRLVKREGLPDAYVYYPI